LARYHSQIVSAGARVVGISVDPPERNAAMVDKLALPYPLLADPGGEQAIKPFGVWHDGQNFARPAVVVLAPGSGEILRQVGEDFADRLAEEDLIEAIRAENLPATSQPRPAPSAGEPGPDAVELSWLPWYFRGAKLAVVALAGRVESAREQARRMRHTYDRFLDAVQWLEGEHQE
jgi:hypothetical protein